MKTTARSYTRLGRSIAPLVDNWRKHFDDDPIRTIGQRRRLIVRMRQALWRPVREEELQLLQCILENR